jgi:hypothetical protein
MMEFQDSGLIVSRLTICLARNSHEKFFTTGEPEQHWNIIIQP